MGKPRRATASMGRGPDHGVYLCRNQRRFIIVDVDAATEYWPALPEGAPKALKLHTGETLGEMMSHSIHRNICSTGHIVVETNRLALKATEAGRWRYLEINSVCGRGHDLQLHANSLYLFRNGVRDGLRAF
jgi:hypothetical protein